MKSALFALLLLLPLSSSVRAETLSLRQHMQAMGYLMDAIWVHSADQKSYAAAADKTAELRGHLTIAIGLVPPSIEAMSPNLKRAALIDYHQLMARTIHLSANLEQILSRPDVDPISGSRPQDIRNLLQEISVVVGRGHGKYRDK